MLTFVAFFCSVNEKRAKKIWRRVKNQIKSSHLFNVILPFLQTKCFTLWPTVRKSVSVKIKSRLS